MKNPATFPASDDEVLTTNQGVAIGDNQNSLKAGLRGPSLLEDFILREKITHFDHERIPERVVHARGSADTVRDVRGFAVKPEPHNGMPQAASAHDTFWDFASLMPETTHTLMWVMSDRGIPRSLRMMQGFGVHTFRLVNNAGDSHFVKFHWTPKLGTHSLVWDEAVKIAGADSDFHRRDLWDAIESGEYPEWELGLQIFTEAQAAEFSFDVLDATKLIPEELIPILPVGRMVLDRNPGNFFAETEQVAFCTAHVIPGIDFSNDPLLAGRIHSYIDTQISRLGGANFHELPINAPLAAVHNNQRDGMHRQANGQGRVAYEPNSLGGGCPFEAGSSGFVSFPETMKGEKLRGKSEKFLDHYTQATLFYESQTDIEKAHIIAGFRFELSKLSVTAIRERMLASLMNVSIDMATRIAKGLGMELPAPMPRVQENSALPEVLVSPSLSLTARPGDGSIRTRKVAFLIADGVHGASIATVEKALTTAGAMVTFIAPNLGPIQTTDGAPLTATATLENSPAVLFDALVLPDGPDCIATLAKNELAREFVMNQFRHGKTILVIGGSGSLLENEYAVTPGVVLGKLDNLGNSTAVFLGSIGKHRHPDREILS